MPDSGNISVFSPDAEISSSGGIIHQVQHILLADRKRFHYVFSDLPAISIKTPLFPIEFGLCIMEQSDNTYPEIDEKTAKRISRLRRLTERPISAPSEYFQNFVFINYIYVFTGITHLAFALVFHIIGAPELRTYALVGCMLNFVSVLFNYQGLFKWSLGIFIIEVHVFILLCVLYFGGAGFHYFLFPIVVLLFLLAFEHTWFKSVWAVADSLLFITLNYYSTTSQVTDTGISTQIIDFIRLGNTNATFLFLALIGYHYSRNTARAEHMLQRIATTDTLTGLSNRRDFTDRFDMETARFSRNNRPFSLIMGDIDLFKKINDTLGHDCGDYVIKTVATILKESLRQQDVVGRWGGEEFIIMLPETTLFAGDKTAEKLRRSIESHQFSYHDEDIHITMSFGVSVFDRPLPLKDLVLAADQCLYYAKESGRNRVVSQYIESAASPYQES